jgi:TctA family transporter
MEELIGIAILFLPLLVIALWVVMLRDWYYHAHKNRQLWLVVILLGGALGYIFFMYSSDRD